MRRLGRILIAFAVRAVAVLLLLGIAGVATYLTASAALPDLGSPELIQVELEQRVLAARELAAHVSAQRPLPFAVDEDLLDAPAGKAFLGARGCGSALHGQVETRGAFRWLLVERLFREEIPLGLGRCEFMMAEGLVSDMSLDLTRSQRLLAAGRIHDVLSPDALRAYWASSYAFTSSGPFGLDEGAQRLFGKPAPQLSWNEAAVLTLAAEGYEDVATCRYPPKLHAQRDGLLSSLASEYPSDASAIAAAITEKLPCERPK